MNVQYGAGPAAKRFKPNGSPYTPGQPGRPPAQQQQQQQQRQQLPQPPRSWPLIPGADYPAPLYHPLAAAGCQARHTTFPSRLRLGTTGLVQPIYTAETIARKIAEQEADPVAAAEASFGTPGPYGSTTELGKRVRKVVNYAEIEARNEEVDESDEESSGDDGSFRGGPGGQTSRQRAMMAGMQKAAAAAARTSYGMSAAALAAKAEADRKQRELDAMKAKTFGDGRIYLGERPPARHVLVQRRDRRTTTVAPSIDEVEAAAEDGEGLIPIRIAFDTDTLRIRDRFVWNMHERHITPEVFAHTFCVDLDLPRDPWMSRIASQIRSQVEEFMNVVDAELVPEDEAADEKVDVPDLRVILHLDVQMDQLHLTDRVEWDLASPLTPELFASQYILDLGLPLSSAPLIAHAVHEEVLRCKRECFEHGLIGSNTAQQRDVEGIIRRGPRKLEGVWREWTEANNFGPRVEELSVEEIEAAEAERERVAANRRIKRDVARAGFRRR